MDTKKNLRIPGWHRSLGSARILVSPRRENCSHTLPKVHGFGATSSKKESPHPRSFKIHMANSDLVFPKIGHSLPGRIAGFPDPDGLGIQIRENPTEACDIA